MNEYYWDNYTEMDQYGYEDYDNRAGAENAGECQSGENWKMRRRSETYARCTIFSGSVDSSMTEKTSRKIFTSESEILQESVVHCRSFTTGEPW